MVTVFRAITRTGFLICSSSGVKELKGSRQAMILDSEPIKEGINGFYLANAIVLGKSCSASESHPVSSALYIKSIYPRQIQVESDFKRKSKKKKRAGGIYVYVWASWVGLVVKNLPANAGYIRDAGSVPGLRRSPGRGHGNPLQYFCLENPMHRGGWWVTVHRVTELDTTQVI